jgi:hypothetical protein
VNNPTTTNAIPRAARYSAGVATGALVLMIRGAAAVVFLLMAMAEPFLAVLLSGLAIACFFVAVLFGFILHAPFHHRWFVLGASVVFLMTYVLYRFLMLGVQRLMRLQ